MWRNILFAVLLQVLPPPTAIPTITPLPTSQSVVPRSDVYNFLATTAANVNNLPDDISRPGGVPLLASANTSIVFGYGRWLLSSSSMNEFLGPTVAPLGTFVLTVFTLLVIITIVYFTIRVAVLIFRGVVWLISRARSLLPI